MRRNFLCLFSTVMASAASVFAAEPLINDDFNTVKLERSSVAIEDHPEQDVWRFQGSKKNIRCVDGVLTLGAAAGGGEVRMVSRMKFKSGELKTRIRFEKTGKGIHFYIGYFQSNPWNYRSAWLLFNESGNGHLFMTNGENKMPRQMIQKIRTGNLQDGQWYDLVIKLDETGSELFIDGVSKGKLALPDAAPDQGMNLVFVVNPGSSDTGLSIDYVKVNGVEDKAKTVAPVIKKVAIPVPQPVAAAKAEIKADAPAEIVMQDKKVRIENGFFRYVFDTGNGLLLQELFSKFLNRNVLLKSGKFFAVYDNYTVLPNSSFKVTSVDISGDSKQKTAVFHLNNPEKQLAGTLTITAIANSPELIVKPEFINKGKKEAVVGVSCPMISSIKIGDSAADDEFFYPMESGMAGKLDSCLRQVYGMTLFMQLLSVWNPTANGGIYAYTRDKTGYPKIMEILKISNKDADPHGYDVVPWSKLNVPLFSRNIGTSMGWRHLDFKLAPGGKTDIPDAVIGVNQGAWQSGMKSYSDFVKTWFKKPYATPRWYTEMYAALSAHPHSGLWIFSSSPSKGYFNKKTNRYSYGESITHLEKNVMQEIAFWWDKASKYDVPTEQLGQFGLPFINVHQEGDYDYNVSRGGLQALRDEISLIHSKESRLILYTMVRGAAKGTKAYEIGRPWAQINEYGRPKVDYTGEGIGWNFCDMDQRFAEHYSTLLAQRIAETDADGFRLDVLCRVSPCFNPGHAHFDGTLRSSTNPVLLGETLKKFKSKLFAISPEKIVTVEHAGNDYISQFHDGYFAENICWISESPQWAHFRKLNAYMTVFTRFYFPEVKTWIHGASNSDEAVRMSLFNACGFACTSHKGIKSFRTLEENCDTFDSNGEKLPHIPTPTAQVFANSFAPESGTKHIWTVFNRSGKSQSELLEIPEGQENFRFIEVYTDRTVVPVKKAGKTALILDLPHNEVAVIARFARQMNASLDGNMLSVTVDDPAGKHCRVIIGDDNYRAPQQDLPLSNGKLQKEIPSTAKKIIVKLYSGKYLCDEIIITR